jgi:hypothetical protein
MDTNVGRASAKATGRVGRLLIRQSIVSVNCGE